MRVLAKPAAQDHRKEGRENASEVKIFAQFVDTHGLTPVALAKEVFIYIEGCMPSNSL